MKDITLYEFNSLSEFEKGEALWEFGSHVSDRFEGKCRYALYQLSSFYVEVEYNGKLNQISKFISFSTYTKLEPYLDKIDISQLIN